MTNYERIKNKSIEEIAKYIDESCDNLGGEICKSTCERMTGSKYKCPYGAGNERCVECIVEWLNSEVDTK